MAIKYDLDDVATFYFIINHFDGHKEIQAWTDSKGLAKAYMDFHSCKNFKLKCVKNTMREINKIIEDNIHDEIGMCNILIKDPEKRGKSRDIFIPATSTELTFLNEESKTFMASYVDYSLINEWLPMLKSKYQRALSAMLLPNVVSRVIHNKADPITRDVEFDYLSMLYKGFPDNFGK